MSRKRLMVALGIVVLTGCVVGGVVYADPGAAPPCSDDPVFLGMTVEELAACGQMDPMMFAQVVTGEIPPYAVLVNTGVCSHNNTINPDAATPQNDVPIFFGMTVEELAACGQMDPTMFAQVITGGTPPDTTR